jgi:glycosidase
MILTTLAVVAIAQNLIPHTFTYVASRDLTSVHCAGTFNGWDRSATPMKRESGREWKVSINLAPGKHSYKFVLDGNEWITDPKATKNEDDGNGNLNSVLIVLPADYAVKASPVDGQVAQSGLLHLPEINHRNWDLGELTLRLRTRANDVDGVEVHGKSQRYPMLRTHQDDLYDHYEVQIPWNRKGELDYHFRLKISSNRWANFGAKGYGSDEAWTLDSNTFQPFEVPAWVEKSVIYQIFPDRFENGDRTNDPKNVEAWTAEPTYFNRFGGDAAGVSKRSSYLSDLGIDAVYFNPVFQSPSNHRYDATDFRRIDREIGTNEDFKQMAAVLRGRKIRTIMDFVFNHTATDFGPFLDLRKNGEASAYKHWFTAYSYPVEVKNPPNYKAWFNFPSMPVVNIQEADVQKYLLESFEFWRKDVQLSGVRLDVANEVPMEFWRTFRRTVKTNDPNLWIVGEVWGDPSPWLKGDQWDASMNYPFRDAMLGFLTGDRLPPSRWLERLMSLHASIPSQAARNQMNLLSSHDTPRFLTLIKGDRKLMKLAATVQFSWVGAPSIYYGEEIGMEGGRDPENRRAMRWDLATPDNDLLKHYKKLVRMRKDSKLLQSGRPMILAADDGQETAVFGRQFKNQIAVVAINRSKTERSLTVKLPTNATTVFRDAIDDSTWTTRSARNLELRLPPESARVLLPTDAYSAIPSRRLVAANPSHTLRTLRRPQ